MSSEIDQLADVQKLVHLLEVLGQHSDVARTAVNESLATSVKYLRQSIAKVMASEGVKDSSMIEGLSADAKSEIIQVLAIASTESEKSNLLEEAGRQLREELLEKFLALFGGKQISLTKEEGLLQKLITAFVDDLLDEQKTGREFEFTNYSAMSRRVGCTDYVVKTMDRHMRELFRANEFSFQGKRLIWGPGLVLVG